MIAMEVYPDQGKAQAHLTTYFYMASAHRLKGLTLTKVSLACVKVNLNAMQYYTHAYVVKERKSSILIEWMLMRYSTVYSAVSFRQSEIHLILYEN